MSKSVLITGAHGLIGGRLIEHLKAATDWNVVALSRSQRSNADDDRVFYKSADWSAKGAFDEACKDVDCVVHLAAMNEPDGEKDPEQALLDNGLASLKLLNSAVAADVKRFVYVSTAKVYGTNLNGTVTEETPVRPLNHYAITHHVAEDYVLAAHAKKQIEGVALRLSNGVGAPVSPGVNCWMLIANGFCQQALTQKKIVLSGTGLQWRNFVPLAHVIKALAHAMDVAPDKLDDGLFNLGGEGAMRIVDLANMVAERCGVLFGYTPDVQTASTEGAAPEPELWFKSDKLGQSGLELDTDLDSEIDRILTMCAEMKSA